MALVSPGVEVTVIDQSTYVPSVAGTVPYILIATAQDKSSGTTVGTAVGTLKSNANRVYLITSQFDLLEKFGNPIFTSNGAETNEYGLLAAYSALGVSNRCYVQRVDVDLNTLKGSLNRPSALPQDGSWYLDTQNSRWGFNVWNVATNSFTYQEATLLTNPSTIDPSGIKPAASYGKGGEIAIVATDIQLAAWQKIQAVSGVKSTSYVGTRNNTWQLIGSVEWTQCLPTIQSTPGPLNFTTPQKFTISNFSNTLPNSTSVTSAVSTLNNVRTVDTSGYSVDPNTGLYTIYIYPDYSTSVTASTSLIWWGNDAPNYGFVNVYTTTKQNFYAGPVYQSGKNYTYPAWNTLAPLQHTPQPTNSDPVYALANSYNSPSGSIWQNVTDSTNGANIVLKRWSSSLGAFTTVRSPMYYNDPEAISTLDPTGGGYNIPIDTTYTQYDTWDNPTGSSYPPAGGLPMSTAAQSARNPSVAPGRNPRHTIFRRYSVGPTIVTGLTPNINITSNFVFTVSATAAGSAVWNNGPTFGQVNAGNTLENIVSQFNAAAPAYVTASIDANGRLVISHSQGGSVAIYVTTGNSEVFFEQLGLNNTVQGCYRIAQRTVGSAGNQVVANTWGSVVISNWNQLTYGTVAGDQVNYTAPQNNTLWYWTDPTQADIMIQNNGQWVGYRTVTSSVRGENLTLTNATGPMFATTAPVVQSSGGGNLVAGDLWIDTSDLENYPKLYRWTVTSTKSSWVSVDTNDTFTTSGVLFADARWATNGTTNPATDPIPTISSLLTSNYLDLDAPNPQLSPQGILLWNTRRSGYNVKSFQVNYFNSSNFPGVTLPAQTSTWLSVSGNKPNGGAYMGRQAQRSMVVQAMRAGVDTSVEAREEQKDINLLAAPQYPELAVNLNALNIERGDTGFVIVDTPLRLSPDDVVTWATNNNGLGTTTSDGLLVGDAYTAAWYPSCLTTDLSGNQVVTAPSHMILRTILKSDNQSYPWIASAGTQRGLIDNAIQIGYLNSQSNNFESISVRQGLRDVLYTNRINPITVIPGSGIVNFGNKTTTGVTSALDRINVARLVAFLRRRLAEVADQYLFEPNDQITRNSVKNVIDGLMIDLVAKRALYDYLVVCDLSNNTPDRIDRNELWIDIAIEPVKSVEFIYIPVRIKNTGGIAATGI